MSSNNNKKALIVIPHYNFRDEEYNSARSALESSGASITIASTVKNNATGSQGLSLDPDFLIEDINPNEYDIVVFIGGTGSSQYWHDVTAHDIIKTLAGKGKVVAASSHAPVTLAVAGILTGKKATGHMAVYEKLQVAGAQYTGKKIEVDGNIITSTGANAVKEFSQALKNALN